MSCKNTKKSLKSGCSTINNPTVSKFFLSDSSYPTTSLKKRNAAIRLKDVDQSFSPSKKLPKHNQELDISVSLGKSSISKEASNKLQLFTFKKCKYPAIEIENSSESFSCSLEKHGIENSCSSSVLKSDDCEDTLKSSPAEADIHPKYTPLEKQYLKFKSEYPDAILLIECGYKYKIFGKDAEIVSTLFNLAHFKSHNFMSACILSHRLHFYVRQLVSKGHKVGVIKQAESAALKAAGETRNELFSRKLDALYTKSTLIGEEFLIASSDDQLECDNTLDTAASSEYLMCVCEDSNENNKPNKKIAFVAVQVSSGDMSYAVFEDSAFRNQLETFLIHVNPGEILLPTELSEGTEKVLTAYTEERPIRTERVAENIFEQCFALEKVSTFFTENILSKESPSYENIMQTVLFLPPLVISCLSALIHYLSKFCLENSLNCLNTMKSLSTDDNMILSSTTLKGLEIFTNISNQAGSLFWLLNRTLTKCGERLLKHWISKPLKNSNDIQERLSIITETIHSESLVFEILEETLSKLPDLERILCCIFHQKCSCLDFLKLLQAFAKVRRELLSVADKISSEIEVPRLKLILLELPELLGDVEEYLSYINPTAAKDGDKTKVFYDVSMFPSLKVCQERIVYVEQNLDNLRPKIATLINVSNFQYSTLNNQKYLIEVPHSHLNLVPDNWLKINSIKQVARFKSPEVTQLGNEIEQLREAMVIQANEAWLLFLKGFGRSFYKHKRAVSHLAELDCYLSLVKVAKEEGYCRPQIVVSEEKLFHVSNGWHPTVKKIMEAKKQFVENDISLNDTNRCVIVTGPNMGGKSTYVRQTALIAIMAQMGSYVPAQSVKLSIFDNIYVRMCSEDSFAQGKSTFLGEMTETSEILRKVSSMSFVILDELGRGTGTNDGAAIAYSVLEHLITETRCLTMFVTHYPTIVELKSHYPDIISTVHMGYLLKEGADDNDIETITFLYNVVCGTSRKSYGINVAALAGIPKYILLEAQEKSRTMEIEANIKRKIKNIVTKIKTSMEISKLECSKDCDNTSS